ncbi:MAG: WbqC family protein [Bacteroidales bacterium]
MTYKTISIHQPSYWPWLGQLNKIAMSDTYIYLDSVAAVKDHFTYRNLFYCEGKAKFITLPVDYHMGIRICDLKFKSDNWQSDHLVKIANYYRKAPYFDQVFDEINEIYRHTYVNVSDLLLRTMEESFKYFGITVKIVKASDLDVNGSKGLLVYNICKTVSAGKYIAGMGSFEYMQGVLPMFEKSGIQVIWQKFNHPVYMQMAGFPFIKGLSCLDLLFFQGFEKAKGIFNEIR